MNNRREIYNEKATRAINEQNRDIMAQCNAWAAHVRDNRKMDNELPLSWAVASKVIMAFGHALTGACDRMKCTTALEIRCSTRLFDGKTVVQVQVGTPSVLLKPFEEPLQFATFMIMETLVSDIPPGMEFTSELGKDMIDTFRSGWTDEMYDEPGKLFPLVYITALAELPFQLIRSHSTMHNQSLPHVTKPHVLTAEEAVLLVQTVPALKTANAKLLQGAHMLGVFFNIDGVHAVHVQCSVFPEAIRQNAVEHFDHVTYRAAQAAPQQ